jgi:hypothetical protein
MASCQEESSCFVSLSKGLGAEACERVFGPDWLCLSLFGLGEVARQAPPVAFGQPGACNSIPDPLGVKLLGLRLSLGKCQVV